MPVILRLEWGKVVVRIHSNDHEPPHVHVMAPGAEVRVRIADLAVMGKAYGFDSIALKAILAELEIRQHYLQEQWDEIFGED